jgi:energy-coupling factor transporter ATP-binding protein EcfA2
MHGMASSSPLPNLQPVDLPTALHRLSSHWRRARRIVIDGPSGSGKTTAATAIAAALSPPLPLLHLDAWYPGWHGLAAGSRIAEELVTGQRDSYPRWDWESARPGEVVSVDLANGWIVEGCGALTPITQAAADLCVWVETAPDLAKQRALGRDGDSFAPWWNMWHEQELHHWATHSPRERAQLIIAT